MLREASFPTWAFVSAWSCSAMALPSMSWAGMKSRGLEGRESRASVNSPHGLDLLDLDHRVVPIRQHRLCADDLHLLALERLERDVRTVQVGDEVSIGN